MAWEVLLCTILTVAGPIWLISGTRVSMFEVFIVRVYMMAFVILRGSGICGFLPRGMDMCYFCRLCIYGLVLYADSFHLVVGRFINLWGRLGGRDVRGSFERTLPQPNKPWESVPWCSRHLEHLYTFFASPTRVLRYSNEPINCRLADYRSRG